jgi:hypothetical protein
MGTNHAAVIAHMTWFRHSPCPNDSLALNLGGAKRFQIIDRSHFGVSPKMDASPKFVLNIVKETVTSAQKTWPGIIREAGLPDDIRDNLYRHWGGLSALLRIKQ